MVVVKERVVRRGGRRWEGHLVLFAIIADSGTIHTSAFVLLCSASSEEATSF
jgi:hypothetical protein